jgi:hypothetical protein
MKIAVFAAVAALAAGCAPKMQSTPPTYAGCRTWEQQAGAPELASVQVLSPDLGKVIGVLEVAASRTGTGMAAVQTVVYNCTDVDVVLQVRTRFSGDRGQSEPPSAWKMVHLAPRAQAVYGESAVSSNTKRIAVDIYDANRGQSQFAPGQQYPAEKK